ncbi:MAG TPA: hypothetical protein VF894_11335 [Anaeromyxobacter sp.]
MKTFVLALCALAVLATATGCIVVPVSGSRAAVKSEKCPPGHVWSDGRCHDKGKGHDKQR